MVNYFFYARDCSFSTANNEHYHTNGLKTLEQFKRDVEQIRKEQLTLGESPENYKIIYLNWGDDCWEVDEATTKNAYLNLECEQMGTEPEWIIRYLKQKYIADESDKIKLLYIITDGVINNDNVDKCFRLNEFMHYEKVVFHAFNEDIDQVNLSVAASFFKSRCIVYRNNELCVNTDIGKDFEYNKINIHTFSEMKNQLKAYITLKYFDKFKQDTVALREIDELKKLRDRLCEELLLETEYSYKIEVCEGIKEKHDILNNIYDSDLSNSYAASLYMLKVDLEQSILSLIDYIVSDSKSYSFNTLKFNPLDEFIERDEISDLDTTSEQEFEIFDFILEDDLDTSYGNGILIT